jgi:hypothetical protein
MKTSTRALCAVIVFVLGLSAAVRLPQAKLSQHKLSQQLKRFIPRLCA